MERELIVCLSHFSRLLTSESCARAWTDIDTMSGRSFTRRRVTVAAASVYQITLRKEFLLPALLGC